MTVVLLDVLAQEGAQRLRRRIRQDRHPTSTKPLRFPSLHGHADQGLLASLPAATEPGFLAADEGLIDLDSPGEPLAAGAYENRAQPVQHRPRRLVGADPQCPLEAQRGDPL